MRKRLLSWMVVGLLVTVVGVSADDGENSGMAVPPEVAAAGSPSGSSRGFALGYAVVNSDGTLARRSGAVSSVRDSTGNYRVKFNQNISKCAYIATIGLSGNIGTEINSSIDVVTANTSNKEVFVDTEDFFGAQVDRGFHLLVMCD